MKTLNEDNNASFKLNEHSQDPKRNGIECDTCSSELWDSSPNVVLTSYPAQKAVHCTGCGFKGYRFV
jgi:hypothetical protein